MFKRAHVSWLLLIIFAFVLMSGGCGGGGGSNGDESPVPAPTPTPEPEGLVRYIAEEGLTVEFDSIEMRNEYIRVTYYVTAEEDNHIKIAHSIYNSQSKIFDADGREFPEFVINFDDVVGIGGQGGEERDIIAGVRTPVVLLYTIAESGYELTTTFPKVTLTINGYTLEFRNIVVE
ncbi:MAG: hypothetical protein LBQ42_11435 [Synergistaceae bacterium]|jgi:hypothetical protein|nr:hypothetical protein [Synergistaceae bacterium]